MKPALFFTAYDRPEYLRQSLETWKAVRGLERWRVVAMIEPGEHHEEIRQIFLGFFHEQQHPDFEVMVNPMRYGVLHHPWVGFERLFGYHRFVVRTEDDLLVSSDIMEYFEWASHEYASDPTVASIHGFNFHALGADDEVQLCGHFNPLVWGTWRNRWRSFIGPTWDHDYSTFNERPGFQAGWDWNLNTRIYPDRGMRALYPLMSRVDNIGLVGTHSTPENFRSSASFQKHREPGQYREVTGVVFPL